jgi:hypothetical protein
MGYRGEDASRRPANWGHQPPRPSSPGAGHGSAGAWTDGAQPGYGDGDYNDYASGAAGYGYDDGGGYGGYPQSQPAGEQAAQWPDAPYGQPDPYRSPAPYGGPGGYDAPAGYDNPAGYDQAGGYRDAGDYRYQQPGAPAGYAQPPGYDQDYGQQGYSRSPEPGYGAPAGGSQRYQAGDGPGARGGYPGAGGYPGQDAGNDWYGGQPAAASGASFADTGTYTLNGRIIEEYGTGPREAMRNPARGYPPAPGQSGAGPAPGRAQLPAPARPVISGPQSVPRSGPQEQYGEYGSYPGYGGGPAADGGRGPAEDYPTTFRGAAGDYPTSVRTPGGGYQASGRDPSGGYPAADRSPSGDYPTARGGYGQEDSYRQAGRQGHDDYGDPAGYTSDYRGGYDDYAADGDHYQDPYGGDADPPVAGQPGKKGRGRTRKGAAGQGSAARGGGKERGGRPVARGPRRRRPLGLAVLAVAVVLVACAAVYVFALKPSSNAKNGNAAGPLPSAGSQPSAQACVKVFGTYCHIENRMDDPTPLTVAELFPPVVNNETNGKVTSSFTLATTKVDKTCASAVIGSNLIAELKDGHCTQVLRASYVSGNGKIMGTIGVINLQTTNEAHYAGKVVDQDNFIAPLAASKGVAKKLGQGTGVVEAEFKGHYLILTWSEFVAGTTPSTTAEDNQLEQFSEALVAGTVNVPLSQRMVTGAAPSPGATA